MAGVGEASAIVALIATAGKLSKAVIDIASKYKDARQQIESFGQEVAILGNILDQLSRLLEKDHLKADDGFRSVTVTILVQCAAFFSELDTYNKALYSKPGSVRNLTFRGRTKWVFIAAELDYLRARLESMKTNLLMMMTMQCLHDSDRFQNDRTVQELSFQSHEWAKRLETSEAALVIPTNSDEDPADNRMSIRVVDTAESARSMRDSILSLYGHRSYYQKILGPREGFFAMALEFDNEYPRISRIIDEHLDDDALPNEAGSSSDEVWDFACRGDSLHSNGSCQISPTPRVPGAQAVTGNDELAPGLSVESTLPGPPLAIAETSLPPGPSTIANKPRPSLDLMLYPRRAKAVRSYTTNASERDGIFFAKDEILHVTAFLGAEWAVRKEGGETGLVPRNYLEPYYPYLGTAFCSSGKRYPHELSLCQYETVRMSDFGYGETPGVRREWLPMRKMDGEEMNGETGIGRPVCFGLSCVSRRVVDRYSE